MIQNYIDGEFVTATGTALDVVRAIQSVNKAAVAWSRSSLGSRLELLEKIAQKLELHRSDLIHETCQSQSMPVRTAAPFEVDKAIATFRYFAKMGDDLRHRDAVGPIGVITSWCFPLLQLASQIAPALATGNQLICKPSTRTQQSPYLFAQFLHEAGVPKGICNFVFGPGPEVGATLAAHPGIPAISFCGRTETAHAILSATAPHLKKVALFLSAKNSAIVLEDANFDQCLKTLARACFTFQGQSPWTMSRIMIMESRYQEFLEKFKTAVESLRLGDPQDPDTELGPLFNDEQMAKLQKQIAEALEERGKLLTGNKSRGRLFQPTVIYDLHNCSVLQQEEVSGPFVLIIPVKYSHEAVKWVNTTPYGLAASVWGTDLEKAQKVAQKIEAGTVWVNMWDTWRPEVAQKGLKASGQSYRGGKESLSFFSEEKKIIC